MPLRPAKHPRVSPVARHAANPVGIIQQSALWLGSCRERDEASRPVCKALPRFAPTKVREDGLAQLVEEARGLRNRTGRMGIGCEIDHGRTSMPWEESGSE
jgi:hypothetical protein